MAILKRKQQDEGEEDDDIFFDESLPDDSICKKIARFFGSFFGLFIILTLYTVGGAYYFYSVESVLEMDEYEAMKAQNSNISDSVAYTVSYLSDRHYSQYWTFNNCSKFTRDQFYAKNGTYFVACTSSSSAVLYSPFCKCVKSYRSRFQNDADMLLRSLISQIVYACENFKYDLDVEGNITWNKAWTMQSSFLFTMTTLATIGYGNIAPTTENGQLICVAYTLIGLGVMMIFLANIGDLMGKTLRYLYSRICCRWCRVRRKKSEHQMNEAIVVTLDDDVVGEEDYMPTEEAAVPIIVTLCVMFTYIIIGTVVYNIWEDWTLWDATYFSFITLATIGFGDFVPGQNDTDKGSVLSVLKLVFTSVYCLLGLALISMGISLMQEQIMAKIAWFAKEIGLSHGEDGNLSKYILTKHYDVMITPAARIKKKSKPVVPAPELIAPVDPLHPPVDEEDEESEEEESEEEDEVKAKEYKGEPAEDVEVSDGDEDNLLKGGGDDD